MTVMKLSTRDETIADTAQGARRQAQDASRPKEESVNRSNTGASHPLECVKAAALTHSLNTLEGIGKFMR